LYASNIISVVKSKKMRWVRHAARMGQMINAHNILVGNMMGRDPSKDLDVGGRMLVWILGK